MPELDTEPESTAEEELEGVTLVPGIAAAEVRDEAEPSALEEAVPELETEPESAAEDEEPEDVTPAPDIEAVGARDEAELLALREPAAEATEGVPRDEVVAEEEPDAVVPVEDNSDEPVLPDGVTPDI